MAGPEAGWYPDQEAGAGARLRYWDGERWTDQKRALSQAEQAGEPAGSDEEPKPLAYRARLAILLLVLIIPVEVWVIFADLDYIDVLNRIVDGKPVSSADLDSADASTSASSFTQFGFYIVSAIVFLFWFARAYYNLPRLGVQPLRYKRGWSIGSWFVPILGLFRPKQIANDIWRGSDAAAEDHPADYKNRPVPSLLHWWWAFYIINSLLGNFVGRALTDPDTDFNTRLQAMDALREERTVYQVDIAASATSIVAAILAIMVIRRITQRQEEAGTPASVPS